MKCLQCFLDVSSECVGFFWGSIEDESDVHISRFSLWSAVEISFVEGCMI